MDLIQKIVGSINNRIYIWQYAECRYPVIESYMFNTPGKDISKITDRYIWVLGQHIFFTPMCQFYYGEVTHGEVTNQEEKMEMEMEKEKEMERKSLVLFRNISSDWEEFKNLQELVELVSAKDINSITVDDIRNVHNIQKFENTN